jgi:hypothetical protein
MTTEELKAHRRAICEALIEGKQCQYHLFSTDDWVEQRTSDIASALFASEEGAQRVRIKPEPRKVWVGWRGAEYTPVFAEDEELFRYMSNKYPEYSWQLVEEPQ